MIQGYYFHLFGLTHCKWLSYVLANLLYVISMGKYFFERISSKKRNVEINIEEAKELIGEISPDRGIEPEFANTEYDDSIDVSIIVPVYNYAELVEANIQSILNQQTKYTCEIILVDDGSTDGASDIVDRYRNISNVKVIHQQNMGIAGARNTGLNNAAGKYIMFVDCDDIVASNCIEILMNRAYSENFDIVMGAHNLVKEKDGVIKKIVPNVYPEYNLASYTGTAKILNYAGLPWGKVYKREIWEKVRYFPGYWYEDSIIHALIFTQCKTFSYESQICYQYKWYEKNFSHIQGDTTNPRVIDRYWLIDRILKHCEHIGIQKDECYEIMLLKHLSAHYYPTVSGLDDKIVDALFVLACDLYKKHKSDENYKLNYMLMAVKKSLEQKDINLWKAASKHQK